MRKSFADWESTAAFSVIVYGIVQTHGIEGLTTATFMAGFLIIGMGLARLGNYLLTILHFINNFRLCTLILM